MGLIWKAVGAALVAGVGMIGAAVAARLRSSSSSSPSSSSSSSASPKPTRVAPKSSASAAAAPRTPTAAAARPAAAAAREQQTPASPSRSLASPLAPMSPVQNDAPAAAAAAAAPAPVVQRMDAASYRALAEGASSLKESGNDSFRRRDHRGALGSYFKALGTLADVAPPEAEEKAHKEMLAVLHQNSAVCALRIDQPDLALEHANKALAINAEQYKALYYKAQALFALRRFEAAARVGVKAARQLNTAPVNNDVAAMCKAYAAELAQQRSTDNARRFLEIAKSLAPSDAEIPKLLAGLSESIAASVLSVIERIEARDISTSDAIPTLLKGVRIENDAETRTDAYRHLIGCLRAESRDDEAIKYAEELLEQVRATKDVKIEMGTLDSLGDMYNSCSRWQDAMESYQKALLLAEAEKDTELVFSITRKLQVEHCLAEDGHAAAKFAESNLQIARTTTDESQRLQYTLDALSHRALSHTLSYEFDKSLEVCLERVELSRKVTHPLVLATALTELAGAHVRLRQYSEALARCLQAHEALQAAGKVSRLPTSPQALAQSTPEEVGMFIALLFGRAAVERTVGVVHLAHGEYHLALEALVRSVSPLIRIGTPEALATSVDIRRMLGQVYLAVNMPGHALTQYKENLDVLNKNKERIGLPRAFRNLAESCLLLGRYHDALDFLNAAVVQVKGTNMIKEEIRITMLIAEVHAKSPTDGAQQARPHFERVSEMATQTNHHHIASLAFIRHAHMSADLQEFETARTMLVRAVAAARRSPMRMFVANALVERAVFNAQRGDWDAAATDARAALESAESATDVFLEEDRNINTRDLKGRAAAVGVASLLRAGRKVDAAELLEYARYVMLGSTLASLATTRSLEEYAQQHHTAFVLQFIQSGIDRPAEQLAVHSLVISSSGVHHASVAVPSVALPDGVTVPTGVAPLDYVAGLTATAANVRDDAKLDTLLRYWSQLVVAPIEDVLRADHVERVVFSPDGPLYLVPQAALFASDGSRFLRSYAVAAAPCVSYLLRKKPLEVVETPDAIVSPVDAAPAPLESVDDAATSSLLANVSIVAGIAGKLVLDCDVEAKSPLSLPAFTDDERDAITGAVQQADDSMILSGDVAGHKKLVHTLRTAKQARNVALHARMLTYDTGMVCLDGGALAPQHVHGNTLDKAHVLLNAIVDETVLEVPATLRFTRSRQGNFVREYVGALLDAAVDEVTVCHSLVTEPRLLVPLLSTQANYAASLRQAILAAGDEAPASWYAAATSYTRV